MTAPAFQRLIWKRVGLDFNSLWTLFRARYDPVGRTGGDAEVVSEPCLGKQAGWSFTIGRRQMLTIKRFSLVVAAVLALFALTAPPLNAQTENAETLNKQVVELINAKKFAEAEPLAKRLIEMRTRMLGREHADVGAAKRLLAHIYRSTNRMAEAMELEKQAPRPQTFELAGAPPSKEGAAPPRVASAPPPPPPPPPPSANASPPKPNPQVAPAITTRGVRPTTSAPPPGSSANSAAALPDFPWPPPKSSASYEVPRSIFQGRATVGDVAGAIVSALERTGYVERSFFRTQANGVALVTRLERINDDGSARTESERWPSAAQTYQSSSDLVGFFRGLFYVDRGRYRIIVFVLQDLPFVQSQSGVTGPEARAWLREGANMLPKDIASRPFGDGNCSVLIYEFASDGTSVATVESRLTGKQHLEKSGVLSYLEKSN